MGGRGRGAGPPRGRPLRPLPPPPDRALLQPEAPPPPRWGWIQPKAGPAISPHRPQRVYEGIPVQCVSGGHFPPFCFQAESSKAPPPNRCGAAAAARRPSRCTPPDDHNLKPEAVQSIFCYGLAIKFPPNAFKSFAAAFQPSISARHAPIILNTQTHTPFQRLFTNQFSSLSVPWLMCKPTCLMPPPQRWSVATTTPTSWQCLSPEAGVMA